MPSQKNIQALENLKDKLSRSKAVVFADYKGLNVGQITDLRQKVKEIGGELKVTKNTLLKRALKEYEPRATSHEPFLTGPTATLFAYEDEVAPIKALYEFSQENGLPKFKAGFLGEEFLSAARVTELGQLPEKEILLAKVVGAVNAPLSGLVNVLQGNMRKLVVVLKEIQKNKSDKK